MSFQSLSRISCEAKEASMYVVINHREKVDCNCENCPADGYLIYNTNVVFDRKGVVIARYRKYNLFGEPGTNVTSEAIPTYFTTDFNVTFGQFICFDILFQSPALNLTRSLDPIITDFVFSAHWFSELPYLFAVQAQAAWAYANDVNLLAAGYNNPNTASGGKFFKDKFTAWNLGFFLILILRKNPGEKKLITILDILVQKFMIYYQF